MKMPRRKPTPIASVEESYGPPVRLCHDPRFEKQLGDRVELYGPGIPVVERDGHIVAIMTEDGYRKPDMVCRFADYNGG
jgi:hypothetical protein